MPNHTAFIVGDALTLLAVCGKYPCGFVGVGMKPANLYCCPQVVSNPATLRSLVFEMDFKSKTEKFFLLCPTPDVAGALRWTEADPKCKACGRCIRDHQEGQVL